MAHPFFDSLDWPASRAEAQDLEKALLKRYKTAEAIDNLYNRVAPDLDALTLNRNPQLIWSEALGNLAMSGQLKAFCELLKAQGPKSPGFQGPVDAVINARSATERRVLASGALVVDRAQLRSQVGLLLARDSPVSVLLVRGGPQSGKTHGNYVFEAAAQEAGAVPVYIGRDLVFTLADVIRELFAMVGGVPRKLEKELERADKATTTEAWYQLVVSQLLEAANKQDVRLWIAADDLGTDEAGEPLIDPVIVQFFNQFALAMRAAQYKARFRLMLIHYPAATPTRWPAVIWKADTAVVDDITRDAVLDFLRGWSQERGKVIVEEQLATLAEELMTGLDAPVAPPEVPRPRLQRLYELLDAMTQRLAQA
jgi:hypothetical protein